MMSEVEPMLDNNHTGGKDTLSIGSVAKQAGVSERTIRYYEEIGILKPFAYTPAGHRLYSQDSLSRLRRIRELQDLMGFNLDGIAAVLKSEDQLDLIRTKYFQVEGHTDQQVELIEAALKTVGELATKVQAKIERLEAFKAELSTRAKKYKTVEMNLKESRIKK